MTVTISFKSGLNGPDKRTPGPIKITGVIGILKLAYSVKLITKRNRCHSFENSDIEYLMVQEIKDGKL